MYNEPYHFMSPTGIASIAFQFSQGALQWLRGTTANDSGGAMSNIVLFGDLLARMAVTSRESTGFRRTLTLRAGQAQYSEELLSRQWCMGRKRIRNLLDTLTGMGIIDTQRSRVASIMTFPCVVSWQADGATTINPFAKPKQREKQGCQQEGDTKS